MKYKYIIHEPVTSHNVYEVEAESFGEACSLIRNDMQDEYIKEFNVFDDTGEYILEKRIPMTPPLSLQAFIEARSFVPLWQKDDVGVPGPALVYPGNLYIDITNSGYMLAIANVIYDIKFDDHRKLNTLEEVLYQYGLDEGLFRGPEK